jgi:hypothetical protein
MFKIILYLFYASALRFDDKNEVILADRSHCFRVVDTGILLN